LLTALIAAFPGHANGREGTIGTVRGAEALYVREGPGTEYAAFDTLLKGVEVEVEAVEGSWATVRTAAGRRGYVHATFLELRGDPSPGGQQNEAADAQAARAAAAQPAEAAEPPAERDSPSGQAPAGSEPLRADSPVAAAPLAASGAAAEDELLTDVKRILRLTEELHGQFAKRSVGDGGSAQTMEGSPRAPGVASTLALSGIGILFGFIVGSLYGRHLERNRRTRVRF
jgi:hypothetical protein